MGEIVEFPQRREPCSRWRRSQAAITLAARPTCAALAMALAGTAPTLKAQQTAESPAPVAQGVRPFSSR